MKKNSWILFAPFAFALALSCKNAENSQKTDTVDNESIDTNTALAKASHLDSLEKQVFSVSADSTHFLVGKQGGVILVHPQSFIDESGKPVQGKIDIEFREVQEAKDFVKSRISTVSDGKILQTAGSYFVGASQNGKALQVNPKKGGLFVAIPALKKDTAMRFFVGEKTASGDINWKLETGTKETKLDAPKPPMQELADLKLSLNDKLLADEYNSTKDFLDGIAADYVQKGNEYVMKVESGNKSTFKATFVEQIRRKYQMIAWARDYVKGKEKFLQQKISKLSAAWDNYNKLNQAWKVENNLEPTFYEYQLQKTGWLNCDKFQNEPLIAFSGNILNNKGSKINYARVHLVSEKERIHLQQVCESGSYRFNFPKNKPFKIMVFRGNDTPKEIEFDGKQTNLPDVKM